MEMNFCRRCGTKLSEKSEQSWKCDQNHSTYLNASPTAGVFFVTDDKRVLLSRRAIEPGKGMLDSFGGFIDAGESAEAAALRELREETGLRPDQYEPLQIFCTAPSLYHFEGEDRPVLSTFFWSKLRPDATPVASDDVAEIVTLPLGKVDFDLLFADDVKVGLATLQEIMEVR